MRLKTIKWTLFLLFFKGFYAHTWNQDPDKRPKIEINTNKPSKKSSASKYKPKLKESSSHTVKDVPSFIAGQTFGLDAENHQKSSNLPDIGYCYSRMGKV